MAKDIKFNSPLPENLQGECKKAVSILEHLIKAKTSEVDATFIPKKILENAKGVAVISILKAGFGWSGRAGSGLVVARLGDGRWSAPSCIGVAGVGFGAQIGAQLTDCVFILNTPDAVKAFSHGGNVTVGGNLSVAAGPVGRQAEAGGSFANFAPVYSYSKSKGLFAGVSLEGSVFIARKDANEKFYHSKISPAEILEGKVEPPVEAEALYRILNIKFGSTPVGSSEALSHNNYDGSHEDRVVDRRTSWASGTPSSVHHSQSPSRYSTCPSTVDYSTSADPVPYTYQDFLNKEVSKTGSNSTPVLNRNSNYLPNSASYTSNTYSATPDNYPLKTSEKQDYKRTSAPPPPPRYVPRSSVEMVEALYSFQGQKDTDLSFEKGDLIEVVKKTASDNDWWKGRLNGKEGDFPANYVKKH
ncbi:hypothetical protein HDU92_003380 [Lobulomyces angularis]|nr:hypothetical protein HDU92_003380 [Lobulomyces angularis]